jgi:hypothetical protein
MYYFYGLFLKYVFCSQVKKDNLNTFINPIIIMGENKESFLETVD